MHEKYKPLLEQIKILLKVGSITKQRSKAIQFRVQSIKELKKIFNHFEKYPLITEKWPDYELFKQVFDLILKKEHLTIQGLRKIVAIKASMNLGLSVELKSAFPSSIQVIRPLRLETKTIEDPN